jgi:uncharacterized metal-binding protein
VYPCSGAADTGDGARERGDGVALKRSERARRAGRPHRGRITEQIADRAARRLDAQNVAWMSCLAGIGGRVSGMMANAAAAPALLAIDGCPLDCAKKTLELAGFTHVRHVRVTDLGFKKGKTPATDDAIAVVVRQAKALLSTC